MLGELFHYYFTVKKLQADEIIEYIGRYYIILFFKRVGPKPYIMVIPLSHAHSVTDLRYRDRIYLSDRKIKRVSQEKQDTLKLLYS